MEFLDTMLVSFDLTHPDGHRRKEKKTGNKPRRSNGAAGARPAPKQADIAIKMIMIHI
jgi:hypothetical protein